MISVFVVEDEENILKSTLAMLEHFAVKVLGFATEITDAYKQITLTKPQLVLLDVELGQEKSFDLLKKFDDNPPFQVVFITAHQKYALDAFRFSAIDFLLKPLSLSALEVAIERAEQSIQTEQNTALQTLRHNLQSANQDQKIILKTQDKIEILKLEEIIHCESDLSYTIFHTTAERIMVSKTMGYYEDLLTPHGFFRIHKSHLVNMKHIRKIHKSEGGEAELTNGTRIPISQRKKEQFLKLLDSQGLH